MQGCSQLSGVIQAMLDYQKIKRYYWRSGHISSETKITWKNTSPSVPFPLAFSCLILFFFFLFLPPSFLLMLCLYDADESAVASVQSLVLFCTDVTAALHNLCLSCCLQSHFRPLLPIWNFTSQVHKDIDLHWATGVSASSLVERNVETTCTNNLNIIWLDGKPFS